MPKCFWLWSAPNQFTTNIGFYIPLNKSRLLVILKALPFQLGHSKNKKNERLLSHRVQYNFVCVDYYTIFKMFSVLGHYHSLSLVWLRLMYLFQGWTLDVSLLLIINLLMPTKLHFVTYKSKIWLRSKSLSQQYLSRPWADTIHKSCLLTHLNCSDHFTLVTSGKWKK